MRRILLVNPNSSETITATIDNALKPLREAFGVTVDCRTLAEGPPGIESQAHVDFVGPLTAKLIAGDHADIAIIACFSDPGLFMARELSKQPVIGIAESAFHLAVGLRQNFGIIAILERSIPRHVRHARALGYADRMAGDRALEIGVAGLGEHDAVLGRMIEVGTALRDEDGAETLILGCAGMGHYRAELEEALGLPVIDPCQAAVARAAGLLALGYRQVA